MNIAPVNELVKNWFEAINVKNYKLASALVSKNSQDEVIKILLFSAKHIRRKLSLFILSRYIFSPKWQIRNIWRNFSSG